MVTFQSAPTILAIALAYPHHPEFQSNPHFHLFLECLAVLRKNIKDGHVSAINALSLYAIVTFQTVIPSFGFHFLFGSAISVSQDSCNTPDKPFLSIAIIRWQADGRLRIVLLYMRGKSGIYTVTHCSQAEEGTVAPWSPRCTGAPA